MVPVAGLARRRPDGGPGQPTLRRTLVDNSGVAPVNITTEAQLQNYPWWNSLSESQQMHLPGRLDPEVDPPTGPFDLHLKDKKGLNFSTVRRLLQQAAPGARNADIFIVHPGPWIYTANTLHLDLQAVMTPGCVAYVLTDNEDGGGQAATWSKASPSWVASP